MKLHKDILDHYYLEHPQLNPLLAVDSLANLVDQMIATMQQNLQQQTHHPLENHPLAQAKSQLGPQLEQCQDRSFVASVDPNCEAKNHP